jgi:ubiquinone/menaquinone biosynthesis C-methylase UbiE
LDALVEMDDAFEIFGNITSEILKQFSQNGSKEDLDAILEYLTKDYFARYHLGEIKNFLKKIDVQIVMQKLLEYLSGDKKFKPLIVLAIELIGVEELRKFVNTSIETQRKRGWLGQVDNLEYARDLFTPNDDKIAIENLRNFYQKEINFNDYKINKEMLLKDLAVLKIFIRKDDKILEIGCGSGRLINKLIKDGYDVFGYDVVEKHVAQARQSISKTEGRTRIFQGDWHQNAIQDKSFDIIYSLGRNILHDYSIIDQIELFKEAQRILKEKGRFIFDIPNRNKGGYKKMVESYAEEMKDRGIKNFRYGAIYDSPDNVHFTTRYAYSPEDIEELARLAGFRYIKVKKEELATGQDDENLYYILEKESKSPS